MSQSAQIVTLLLLLSGGIGAANAQQRQEQPPAAAQQSPSKAPRSATDEKPAAAVPAPGAEGQTAKPDSASANPFPEEESKSAASEVESGKPAPTAGDIPGEEAGSSNVPKSTPDASRSSEDGVSSSRTRLEGLDDTDPDATRKGRKITASSSLHNPKMSAEDVEIGKMYMQSDNYKGAYLRYKEALTLDPENPDAAFGVAESARKLNQKTEALENYKLCIDLDPGGPRSKAARKAMNTLSAAR